MQKVLAFKHSGRVVWRKAADEAVILDVETAVYYSIDGAGQRMWELLGESLTLPSIARGLAEEYDVDTEKIQNDLAELAARLRKERLLEAVTPRDDEKRPACAGRKRYRRPEFLKHGALSTVAGQTEDFSE